MSAYPITLVTDFGVADEFVGVVEGVIARLAPEARVIHVSHAIAPQDVLHGAIVLANALPFLPTGVHLAVVDPGVGSARRALVLTTPDGRLLVGPDNGLLLPAAERCGGVVQAWEITETTFFLHPVSRTFHGRDVFAPIAAHLARGLDPRDVGPELDPGTLARLPIAEPEVADGHLSAQVVAVDRFGNVALAAVGYDLDGAGLPLGAELEIVAGELRVFAVRARTFADVRRGDVVAFEDSAGAIGLAINQGSLAEVLGVRPGAGVVLRRR